MAIMDLQLANNFSIVSGLSASRFPFGKVQAVIRNPNELTGIGFYNFINIVSINPMKNE
jgi:hypothetical protein